MLPRSGPPVDPRGVQDRPLVWGPHGSHHTAACETAPMVSYVRDAPQRPAARCSSRRRDPGAARCPGRYRDNWCSPVRHRWRRPRWRPRLHPRPRRCPARPRPHQHRDLCPHPADRADSCCSHYCRKQSAPQAPAAMRYLFFHDQSLPVSLGLHLRFAPLLAHAGRAQTDFRQAERLVRSVTDCAAVTTRRRDLPGASTVPATNRGETRHDSLRLHPSIRHPVSSVPPAPFPQRASLST